MIAIINPATRTAKFTKCGKQKGFTISLNWHGVAVSKPYPVQMFSSILFLRDYVMRFGTQRQIEILQSQSIDEIRGIL